MLSALMNSIKMIYTIARYYNITERMTNIFAEMTDQMIVTCKQKISDKSNKNFLWEKNTKELIKQPKWKQFNFNEMQIFVQISSRNKLEGMESLIEQFHKIKREFQFKNHDLLYYHNNKFDCDNAMIPCTISFNASAIKNTVTPHNDNTSDSIGSTNPSCYHVTTLEDVSQLHSQIKNTPHQKITNIATSHPQMILICIPNRHLLPNCISRL